MSNAAAWYRQPILWLGGLVFGATLVGCVVMIVLGVRYDDEAVPTAGSMILKMPLARPDAASDPPEAPQ